MSIFWGSKMTSTVIFDLKSCKRLRTVGGEEGEGVRREGGRGGRRGEGPVFESLVRIDV